MTTEAPLTPEPDNATRLESQSSTAAASASELAGTKISLLAGLKLEIFDLATRRVETSRGRNIPQARRNLIKDTCTSFTMYLLRTQRSHPVRVHAMEFQV